MRSHNAEYLIWKRMARSSPQGIKKMYLHFLANRLKKYESVIQNEFDAVLAITQVDADVFIQNGLKKPVQVVPAGVENITGIAAATSETETAFYHLGAMDWAPNVEGIDWFLAEVWPKLHLQFPDVPLYLAGRHMPDKYFKLNLEGVHTVGEVEDATAFAKGKKMMVVPLLSGSGIRVKILEAMALGKVVITTSTGAEGIDCADGQHLLIANTAEEFIFAVGRILQDKNFATEVGMKARQLVMEKYNNEKIARGLADYFRKLI
jgi:glycosyltransferase involved in cell wall biosynthesis